VHGRGLRIKPLISDIESFTLINGSWLSSRLDLIFAAINNFVRSHL